MADGASAASGKPSPTSIRVVTTTEAGIPSRTIEVDGNDFGNGAYRSAHGDEIFRLKGTDNRGTIDLGNGQNLAEISGNQDGLVVKGGKEIDTAKFPLGRDSYDLKHTPDLDQVTVREKGAEGAGTTLRGFERFQFGNRTFSSPANLIQNKPEPRAPITDDSRTDIPVRR